MRIVVPIQLVPDLVEELAVAPSGDALDADSLRWIVNEFDDHALEQALLIKEKRGGEVIVLAPDMDGVEDALFVAAAKGADRLVKLVGDFAQGVSNHYLAAALIPFIKALNPDLVLTGVQAHNSLDGSLGSILAEGLGFPYVGYVAGVEFQNISVIAHKEYPGGLIAEMEVTLPVVLGIQASEKPPRYVPISKVRMVMKSARIDEEEPQADESVRMTGITRMYLPETGERAEMLEGSPEDVAVRIIKILSAQDVI